MTTLGRTTFSTSRLLEFFTEKELTMQIGHGRYMWPIALLKELMDNALDACETAGVAPEVAVEVAEDWVSVRDNGPGLPVTTLERSLDYAVRVSDKMYYASPSRGQLGNALKCVWAAPFVASGECGRVDITTGGKVYQVDVTLDRIAQRPRLECTIQEDGLVRTGTLVKMHWPGVAGYRGADACTSFYNDVSVLVRQYALFNPHATFACRTPDGGATFTATDPAWRKWTPGDPTDPHWYDAEALRALIAAYVADEWSGGRARTVREFVSEFRGLSGTAKQKAITDGLGLSGAYLHDLVQNGDIDAGATAGLLAAMCAAARPVAAKALGIIGEDHFRQWLADLGGVALDTMRYKKQAGMAGDLPFMLEVVFCGFEQAGGRQLIVGLNWAPVLKSPIACLPDWLEAVLVEWDDPVFISVHLAYPRLGFTDRGKAAL